MTPELLVRLLKSIGKQEGLIRFNWVADGCGCAIGSLGLEKAGELPAGDLMTTCYRLTSKDEDESFLAFERYEKLNGERHEELGDVSFVNERFVGTPQERRAYMLRWVASELDKLLDEMEADGKLSRWTPPVIETVPTREVAPSRGE